MVNLICSIVTGIQVASHELTGAYEKILEEDGIMELGGGRERKRCRMSDEYHTSAKLNTTIGLVLCLTLA